MSGEGEFENSPEVTPTWVIAGSAVIIVISYAVLQIIYGLRNFVSKHNNPICSALQDVTKVLVKELPLLGLISLFLKLSGNLLTKICVPPSLFHHDMLLPCSPADRCQAEAERQANAHPTSFCYSKFDNDLMVKIVRHFIF
ncbi:MLO protein [Trifolium repens]|nr:MLO protein [Trifolium repens]